MNEVLSLNFPGRDELLPYMNLTFKGKNQRSGSSKVVVLGCGCACITPEAVNHALRSLIAAMPFDFKFNRPSKTLQFNILKKS
jgi:hypothetical protein